MRGAARQLAGWVRHAQEAAARLRAAWEQAGAQEMSRRRERDGYAAGKAWRGAGFMQWAQGVQAMGGGWTCARALIHLLQRRRTETEKAQQARRTGRGQTGDGAAVVIHMATAGRGADATLTALSVTRVHTGKTEAEVREKAESECFWNQDVGTRPGGGRTPRIREALAWMDTARTIRVYTGRAEDACALERAYEGDTARYAAHQRKTVDVGIAAHFTGHASTLAGILRASGCTAREGTEMWAESRWDSGRLHALEMTGKERARALARVLVDGDALARGGHTIPHTSIRHEVIRAQAGNGTAGRKRSAPGGGSSGEGSSSGGGDATAAATRHTRQRAPPPQDAAHDGPDATHASRDEGSQKRVRTGVLSYDETKRRKTREWTGVYFTQTRKRATRDSIQTGAALLARVSGGLSSGAPTSAKRRRLYTPTRPG